MTFAELEPYENTRCALHFNDGSEVIGVLERMHDAAWRPYFALSGAPVDPPMVAYVVTNLERRPLTARDEPVLPGDLDLPVNAVSLSRRNGAAPRAGTAVLVPGDTGLGWIGVVTDGPASGELWVAATAMDGSRLSMELLSVAAHDVSPLRELGDELTPGSHALRQGSGGHVQVLDLVHAPTLPRNIGNHPSAAEMWSVRFFEPAYGTIQGISSHADPNDLRVPAVIADAIERHYRT